MKWVCNPALEVAVTDVDVGYVDDQCVAHPHQKRCSVNSVSTGFLTGKMEASVCLMERFYVGVPDVLNKGQKGHGFCIDEC